MQLQDFLNKTRENEAKKLKIAEIEVEGFGKVEFIRPKVQQMIEYLNKTTNATVKIKTEEGVMEKTNFEEMVEAAKEFVYNSCSLLQAKEMGEMYKDIYPLDLPLEVFGINETVVLASKIADKFCISEEIEKVEEDIKN